MGEIRTSRIPSVAFTAPAVLARLFTASPVWHDWHFGSAAHGTRVSVTLKAADKASRDALQAALGAYLFESTVEIAPEGRAGAVSLPAP